jgi:hypothetical protein
MMSVPEASQQPQMSRDTVRPLMAQTNTIEDNGGFISAIDFASVHEAATDEPRYSEIDVGVCVGFMVV